MIADDVMKNLGGDRYVGSATSGDESLADLRYLPGTWQNSDRFPNRGWNMIALPFSEQGNPGTDDPRDYRVLANQYNETLILKIADKGVPNRGVIRNIDENLDQTLVALDYQQFIRQTRSQDSPVSGKAKEELPAAIHHEPGLWLQILNHNKPGANIARLGTVPHGNSLLALGTAEELGNSPAITIPEVNPFPFLTATQVPLDTDPLDRYLSPYNAFVAPTNTFFPNNLDMRNLHGLLQAATPTNIKSGIRYTVSTKIETGGIVNTPFIEAQADAAQMDSTFWIYELDELDEYKRPVMVMQYMQVVMLDFFENFDGSGIIRWPHVSLNTMVRTSTETSEGLEMMQQVMSAQ